MAQSSSNSSSTTRRSLRLLTAERRSATSESIPADEAQAAQQTSARQAKSKALEALSTAHHKRRIESDDEHDDSSKRVHSKTSPSSVGSRRSSHTAKRRQATDRLTGKKNLKRQRHSSSDTGDDQDDSSLSRQSEQNSSSNPAQHPRRENSDSDQPSESTETGNHCLRRGSGGRELPAVTSDPSTSSHRRSGRYSNKSYLDYLSAGQPSASRVPVTHPTALESRPWDSTPGVASSADPLHLFHSPTFYQSTSSPPPSSSSALSYSGIVPTTSYQSPLVASAHRHAKASLNMSTESDTDPETSPTSRDILSDPNFLRAAASGSSASAALLQTLSGRVHHLMNRVGGSSSMNGRLQQYIQGMQSPDPDVKLSTLNELCSLLVMSNEDTLPGFQCRALYSPLRDCLADENEANSEIALTACRALTYLMEALPRSAMQVVEATPIFLSKLRSITSIDIAEQALIALEMISKRHGKQILTSDGIGACLAYIEFFSITSQNKALAIVANCCSHISNPNEFKYIREHLETLSSRLQSDDKKTIEHVCTIYARLVENFHRDSTILCEIASDGFLKTMQTMIVVQPSPLNSATFTSILHLLYVCSASCPKLAVTLLKMNIAETVVCLLTGSAEGKPPGRKSIIYKSAALTSNEAASHSPIQQTTPVELLSRTPQELHEIVSLIGEMMPRLPNDEPLFQVDQFFRASHGHETHVDGPALWYWQDDQGQLQPYATQDSRVIENAWQQHEEEVQLNISGRQYLLDLQQLQQVNEETNQARFIKRIATPASAETATEPATPPPTLATEPTDASASHVSSATTEKPVDSRMRILRENLELYNTFVQSLFTLLYEVYNSSAGPAVKHRCLQSLLRMIYYSPSELLENILRQQSISSQIASMLASSDYKIVISALQISEILMKKLPNIFSVYFYREGVVHQIEILIGFGISSSAHPAVAHAQPPATSHSQLDLLHMAENPSTPILGESIADQAMHPYGSEPAPTHRGAGPQLHPKTQPSPYRGGASRRYHAESVGAESSTSRVETRSQRGRVPPPSSSSRIKSSARSMLEDMMSATPEASTLPIGRGRPMRPTGPVPVRPTTFDPSSYPSFGSSVRPRGSASMYVPSPFSQPGPHPLASSAPAAASMLMSAGVPTHVIHNPTQLTLSSQEKSRLKEWIQNQARHFRATYFTENSSTSNIALEIIRRLASAVDLLQVGKDHKDNTKALSDIANILAKGDVSPFEMVHSGLITKLFQYLTDDISIPNNRLERLKLFLHIFTSVPYENQSDHEKDLKEYIIELRQTHMHQEKPTQNVLSHLTSKLHGCINQLEQFPIRVNDTTGRPVPTSALRLISTHQLKCHLARHPQCKTLKQWNSGPVKIDPFALVSALEKYLLLRGIASGGMEDPSGTIDDEDSEVSNESDAEDIINVLAHASTMRLEFLINDHVIPNNMTLFQAVRMYSTATQRTTDGESETDTDDSAMPSTAIWTRVHTINYRQMTNSASAVPAVSTAIGGASSAAASNRSRTSGGANPSQASKTSKKPSKTPKRASSAPIVDELWINGQCPPVKSLLHLALNESISSSLTINDLSLNAISLLHILNSLNLYWYDLYLDTNAMIGHPNSSLTLNVKQGFLSSKLTSKVNRQLQDPVVIMMGQCPSWITEIGYKCSFLFPFETRQMIFFTCAFDRERAMQRLVDSSEMFTQQHQQQQNDAADRQPGGPRIERKKIQLSRGNILPEMEKVLENWNSKQILEVQYEDEVGFGLGPTLEAYSLASKELQKSGLELWRTDKTLEVTREKDVPIPEFVDNRHGLYPAPLGRNAKANLVTKVRQKFKFLGKFMAKALMDSRMIDMPFSLVFYKWMLAEEESFTLEDLNHVDTNLYEQLKKFQSIVHTRDRLMLDSQASASSKSETRKRSKSKDDCSMESSTTFDENDQRLWLDGCRIDDLSLIFILPGHPNIELKKNGRDCSVTIHNLDEYVQLVVYWTLVEGVRRQFESFRDGFNSIFSIQHLQCFYPDELHQVFCGCGSTDLWDLKVLMESTRCDHGYNLNSRAVKWLFDLMAHFNIDEQRAFLQFVTGSPRLPVGGFRMLHPPLTIVRKTAENNSDNSNPDVFLPSVMTCVNYLKLPDYSSKEIMKLKLTTAIRDGQYAFLLS